MPEQSGHDHDVDDRLPCADQHQHQHDHAEAGHSHSLSDITLDEAEGHLRDDARVLSAVGGAAVVSEAVGLSYLKTVFSLGGEDAWWVIRNARKAWRNETGNRWRKLNAAFQASKISLATVVAVSAFAAPVVEYMVDHSPKLATTGVFCAAATATSTVALIEDARNDRLNHVHTDIAEMHARQFRTEGIIGTYVLGFAGYELIGNGNPIYMAIVGGTDCLWTGFRSWRYVSRVSELHNQTR